MSVAKTFETCPFCREQILPGALRCKHCHADLSESKAKKKSSLARFNTFRLGFLIGVLFALVTGFLLYWQVYRE